MAMKCFAASIQAIEQNVASGMSRLKCFAKQSHPHQGQVFSGRLASLSSAIWKAVRPMSVTLSLQSNPVRHLEPYTTPIPHVNTPDR